MNTWWENLRRHSDNNIVWTAQFCSRRFSLKAIPGQSWARLRHVLTTFVTIVVVIAVRTLTFATRNTDSPTSLRETLASLVAIGACCDVHDCLRQPFPRVVVLFGWFCCLRSSWVRHYVFVIGVSVACLSSPCFGRLCRVYVPALLEQAFLCSRNCVDCASGRHHRVLVRCASDVWRECQFYSTLLVWNRLPCVAAALNYIVWQGACCRVCANANKCRIVNSGIPVGGQRTRRFIFVSNGSGWQHCNPYQWPVDLIINTGQDISIPYIARDPQEIKSSHWLYYIMITLYNYQYSMFSLFFKTLLFWI